MRQLSTITCKVVLEYDDEERTEYQAQEDFLFSVRSTTTIYALEITDGEVDEDGVAL